MRERKAVGFPLRKVSLFFGRVRNLEQLRWPESDMEELRRCVGTFEPVMGDDTFDWNVDGCFLDGLDNLRRG